MEEQEQLEQIEESNRRFRENQTKLLNEFVDYVIAHYDPMGNVKDHIPKFLDERSKND